MEYQEFIKQFNRMCRYYQKRHECNSDNCMCPLEGKNVSHCRKEAFENPKSVENVVKLWAENHSPYPTWFTWLEQRGIVAKVKSDMSEIYDTVVPGRYMFEPISELDAKILGIEADE